MSPDPFGPSQPDPFRGHRVDAAGGLPPDYVERFIREIEAIRVAAEATASLIPQQTAELSRKLSDLYDVYQNAGPSRPTAGPAYERIASSYDAVNQSTARRALHARAQGFTTDPLEAEIEGGVPSTSQVARSGSSWRSRVQREGLGDILPLPRYPGAEPNARDMFNYLAIFSANMADKNQQKLDARADQQRAAVFTESLAAHASSLDKHGNPREPVKLDRDGNPTSDVPLSVYENLANVPDPESKMGKVSDLMSTAEGAYAQGRYITGILKKVFRPIHSMQTLGYQTGYDGGGAGPFGLRLPWNAGVMGGLSQEFAKMKLAASEGITPGQASSVMSGLFQAGWLQGPQANAMRTASGRIINANPALDPGQFIPMMDKATRQGTVSLSDFVDTMKKVPDAALASHTSFTQVMSDMDQLGQMNKQMGGTYAGGLQNSIAWSNTTGLPGAVMGQLMQNPFVKGQTFMRSGLMPIQQGLASPYQHMQGIMGALDLLNSAIAKPADLSQPDSIGLSHTISGQDQKESLLAYQLGTSKEMVHTMLANRAGYQAGISIGTNSDDYATNIKSLVHGNKFTEAMSAYSGAPWTKLKKQVGTAVDSQGHKMFEDWDLYGKLKAVGKSDKVAHAEAQKFALDRISQAGRIGDTGHWETSRSFDVRKDGKKHWVRGAVSGKDLVDAAAARQKMIQKYETENTKKFGSNSNTSTGPKLTIELGPAAKKMFHLTDPNNSAKASRNGGGADIPYATPTYSTSPFPDLLTGGVDNTGVDSGYGP